MDKVENGGISVEDRVQPLFLRLKDGLAPIDRWVRVNAKENPVLLLAGAVGMGYLLARLLRGR
jgi:hypothetical protein